MSSVPSPQPARFAKFWILTIPFALLPTLVALIHLAPGMPPAPFVLVRVVLATAAILLVTCAVLARVGSPQAVVAAVGLSMSVFGLFPTAQELFFSFVTAAGAKVFSLAYLLGCLLIAVTVLRSQASEIVARYEMVRRMAVLLTAVIVMVLVYYYGTPLLTRTAVGPGSDELSAVSAQRTTRPDVYHIVLDGFGRPDVLKERYGLDLSVMVGDLKAAGFEVAEDSGAANYTQTYLSLASMLNVEYLDWLAARLPDSLSRVPLNERIQQSLVLATFKRLQYEIVFFGSIYSATQSHRLADRCECDYPWFGEFESIIVQSTPFGDLGLAGIDYRPHRNKVRRTFDALESLAPPGRPRFVFAHVMAPHPPFVFDAGGHDRAPSRAFSLDDGSMFRGSFADYQHGYREQATYIAARVVRVVEHIEQLSRAAARESVVIIHGDHGPRARFHATDPARTDASESLPVLLAIRWARAGESDRPVVSLVNVYRSFFRRYFNADLAQLPDRSFVSSFLRPYQFHEIAPSVINPHNISPE
jgi:hypothetical protein